jgi:hypothetical protein
MDIKKIIKEEINDFDFITNETINPWLDYDGIVFDITPSKEEVNSYIELALNTIKDISNTDSWETDRERDIDNIIRYQKRYGTSVLVVGIINRQLSYSDNKNGYSINTRWVNYSQLIGS